MSSYIWQRVTLDRRINGPLTAVRFYDIALGDTIPRRVDWFVVGLLLWESLYPADIGR
jgi:hypothetical protein